MPKLFLADDSATVRRVIELSFWAERIEVVAVADGEDALARIPLERPDIVLADAVMPKRSGYEVAEFVRGHAELAHVPIVILTDTSEAVDQARCHAVGCRTLAKPFDPQDVIDLVRALLPRPRLVSLDDIYERLQAAVAAPPSTQGGVVEEQPGPDAGDVMVDAPMPVAGHVADGVPDRSPDGVDVAVEAAVQRIVERVMPEVEAAVRRIVEEEVGLLTTMSGDVRRPLA